MRGSNSIGTKKVPLMLVDVYVYACILVFTCADARPYFACMPVCP